MLTRCVWHRVKPYKNDVMSSKPYSVDRALLRAKSQAKKGELKQAQKLYQAVLEKFPKNKKAIEGLKALSKPMRQGHSAVLSQDKASTLIGLYKQGRLHEALTYGIALAELHPNIPLIPNLLGAVYTSLGRKEEAIANFHRSIEINPDYAEAHNNFGAALNRFGKYEEAVTSLHKALELEPEYADAHNNFGISLNKLGKHEMAVASYSKALELKPDYTAVFNNLGNTFQFLGRYEEAAASFHRALELKPDYAEAHYNLGGTLKCLGMQDEAIVSYIRAVDLDNDYISARSSLLHQLGHICDWDQIGETIQSDLKLLALGTTPREVAVPFDLLALIDDAKFHRRVSEAYAFAKYKPNHTLGPLLNRHNADRIRVGYFSADFHNHATMYLMAELFERHDRSKFKIHAFSFGPNIQDGMRSRLLNSVEDFHDVRLKGDAEIAALSRSLGVDIAVDLKGYTNQNRAGIFSYRAAPIQVNYLGYPGTMGASYVDYIIADTALIPPAYQEFYSEKVAYLPNSYQANDSTREISDKAISRLDFGLPEEAFVFCCFNVNNKIMPDVFDIWMRLLGKVEGSVLWLFKANKTAEKNLRKEALKRDINPDRLIFAEHIPPSNHLARHQLADLFLDTFNFNAHTTASDALWAGLPVLTKMGESFASRVAGSLLHAVELSELITTSAEEYEDTALMLATHPHELKELKEKLRRNLKTTALFDAVLITKHIESAYTHMYKRLNEGLEPEHIYVGKQNL